MKTSLVTIKGQVTIPAKVRRQIGLHQGDRVGFVYEDGRLIILPVIQNIEAAFGLVKAEGSASLDDMKKAVQSRGGKL
jgi:AbrB family looped-hinge helix DNA binding protein